MGDNTYFIDHMKPAHHIIWSILKTRSGLTLPVEMDKNVEISDKFIILITGAPSQTACVCLPSSQELWLQICHPR